MKNQYVISWLMILIMCCGTLLLSLPPAMGDYSVNTKVQEPRELLDKVLRSMDKMLGFFGEDYSSINVDGLFGIRVGQGAVNQTLTDCNIPGFKCPRDLVDKLRSMYRNIEDIVHHAMPYVEEQDPEYFRHFRTTVDAPYILQYQTEVIGSTRSEEIVEGHYDEERGDKCLSGMMGQYEGAKKCSVSDDCWDYMTKGHSSGYTLTHQLLYFIVADKTNCVENTEKRLKTIKESSLRVHETKLCTQILAQTRASVKHGRVSLLKQDLFLEQCLLCGILGYQDFMNPHWVEMALSWQNDQGCFFLIPSLVGVEGKILELRDEQRHLLSLMKTEAINIERSQARITGRKLLREKIMKGDCLAHKTGLGFGLVGAYIRHYVRASYGPENLSA